jgi:hypothetical protein
MKKTKIKEAVVGIAAGMAITVMVGKIVPVNLHANPTDFTTVVCSEECCGPHVSGGCDEFKYVPAD